MLATCWKITRRDGVVLGFTDHDADITHEAVTYVAATGFTPTAIASQSSLAVDNLDVEGMISAEAITEQDVLAGHYDYAEIEVFLVNYADLSQGVIALRTGWLGEIELRNQQFITEVRGLTQALSQTIGDLYSPVCRATFGDSACGVNVASYTVTGGVTSVMSRSELEDSLRVEDDGTFTHGLLTFTSGANNGIAREVKRFREGGIVTNLPFPHIIEVGDNYSLSQGCDKSFTTCAERYNNALNFRGEPHVPGIDKMLETASTRSGE